MPRRHRSEPGRPQRTGFRALLQFRLALLAAACLPADAAELESIVVTASRHAQNPDEISASIAAVSAEDLERIRAVHVSEALSRLPGTWITRGNGQEHLTAIRSPVFTGAGSCGAFYVAEDGIPIRPAGVCNVNELMELNSEQAERIEVLRGPGTAIHGSNAQHGVINVISMPPPESRETRLSLEAGANQYLRLLASHGDARPGNAWRLSANIARDEGYKEHSGFNQQKLSYRHDLEWSRLSFSSLLSLSRLDQQTAGYVEGKGAYRDSDLRKQNPNPEAFRYNRSARWYGRFSFDRENGDSWSVTPYLRWQEMRFLQHFLLGQPLEENGLYSAGLQSNWHHVFSDSFNIDAGVDAEWSRSYLEQTQAEIIGIPAFPAGKQYDFEVDGWNGAAFVQLGWQAAERTHVNAGARIERQYYDYDNRMIDGATREDGTPCGAAPCRYSRPADRSDGFTEASFNAGLVQRLNEVHSLVLNAAHGFRPPQTAELYRLQAGQLVSDIDSEQIDNIEIGWRASAPRLQWQLVGFRMRKSDVIFQDAQRRNVSGARTHHHGIEYSLAWQINEQWSFEADGSWAVHRYASSDNLQGLPPGVDIDGNLIDTAPKWMSSTRLRWSPDQRTTAELEWQRMGRHYLEPTQSFDYPGHDLLYLRLRRELGSGVYVAARINNLADEKYAERADYAFGNYRYFVGEPRSLFLEAGWKF